MPRIDHDFIALGDRQAIRAKVRMRRGAGALWCRLTYVGPGAQHYRDGDPRGYWLETSTVDLRGNEPAFDPPVIRRKAG